MNRCADGGVAGDRPGPDHRLALPHQRPAVEVRRGSPRRCGRAGPACPPGAGPASMSHSRARPASRRRRTGGARSPSCSASAKSAGVVAVVDEEHVEVAGVGQLRTAEAAEGDDGEGQRAAPSALERGLERGLGQRGDVARRPRRRRRRRARRGAITPSRWRSFHRRSARWRSSTSLAPRQGLSERASTSSAAGRVRELLGVGEAGRSGRGCAAAASPSSRLVPTEAGTAAGPPPATRGTRERARSTRCGSAPRLRRPSKPEVGVGRLRQPARAAAAASAASAATSG